MSLNRKDHPVRCSALFLQYEEAGLPPFESSDPAGGGIADMDRESYDDGWAYSIQIVSQDGSRQAPLAAYGYKPYVLTVARRMTGQFNALRPLIDNPYIAVDPRVFTHAAATRFNGRPCAELRGEFSGRARARIICENGSDAGLLARRIEMGFKRLAGNACGGRTADIIYPDAFGFGKE